MANTDSTIQVLDYYENNATVRCPACEGVFVVYSQKNWKTGRECPHCQSATVCLDKDGTAEELK